jgi:GH35 family endo-1,4-beta-xylanase
MRLITLLLFVGLLLAGFRPGASAASASQVMSTTDQPALSGSAKADATIRSIETDHGGGFRLTTKKQPGNHYDIEARVALQEGIEKGDVIRVSFWGRAVEGERYETGEGFTLFRIQRTAPPWERGLYKEFSLGPVWKQYHVAEKFDHTLPTDSIAAVFSGGYPPQTLEIAGLSVENLGPDADPQAQPQTTSDYLGSEPEAAWRHAAIQRIEQHRKADHRVMVVDADGRPVAGVTLRAELMRHDFQFGAAISAIWLNDNWDTEAGLRYRTSLTRWFNSIAIENALKWARWEKDPEVALRTLRWANEVGLDVHGHVLVWPGLEKFRVHDAQDIWSAAQEDPEILRRRVSNHIDSILSGTAGMIGTWDVVNEAYNQNDFIKLLGEPVIAEWFIQARAGAPDATLLYNDFGLIGQNGTNRPKQQFVKRLIAEALQRGAPIDAIGFQSHLGGGYTPPARVLDILDDFGELGLDLQITEYDLSTKDPELAERYTRDFLIAVFSHPQVTGFQMWNYWSATPTWFPEASVFGDDWSLLPVGRAYLEMVHNRWNTDVVGITDSDGRFDFRGFKGDYRFTLDDFSEQTTGKVDAGGGVTVIKLHSR